MLKNKKDFCIINTGEKTLLTVNNGNLFVNF